jgi:hypothetical protein
MDHHPGRFVLPATPTVDQSFGFGLDIGREAPDSRKYQMQASPPTAVRLLRFTPKEADQMPEIRGVSSGGAAAPSSVVTRLAWLGAALGALAAVHAVEGIVQIARDVLRSETPTAQGASGARPRGHDLASHEAAGWVLIAAAAVAVGAMSRAAADLAETARQILHARHHGYEA